jgi:hypothetical protein
VHVLAVREEGLDASRFVSYTRLLPFGPVLLALPPLLAVLDLQTCLACAVW